MLETETDAFLNNNAPWFLQLGLGIAVNTLAIHYRSHAGEIGVQDKRCCP